MRLPPKPDWFLNVLLPLALGVGVYWSARPLHLPWGVAGHLPDGLWAYSLLSAVLLVWQRRVVTGWVLAAMGVAVGFEALQSAHWIAGTGDLYDILTYFIFFAIALALNPKYEKSDKTSRLPRRPHRLCASRGVLDGQ
ncbi:hypothetical protein [Puia sp.]|jgi:hypothetical protein|uniref:hypothetical protein n=1 Tax=Puia sp. TaxID=2045100 RepID=UPI002F4212E1